MSKKFTARNAGLLMGDETLSYAGLDWSITREVTLRPDGVTLYKRIYGQASASVAADGGNDFVAAGTGADYVHGGAANDESFYITASEVLLKKAV